VGLVGLGGWRKFGEERLRDRVLDLRRRGNGDKLLGARDHVDVEADASEAGVWQGRDLCCEVLAVIPGCVGLDGVLLFGREVREQCRDGVDRCRHLFACIERVSGKNVNRC